VVVREAPPRVIVERRTPRPSGRVVWVDGYWDHNDRGYYWVKGAWQNDRPGYVYRKTVWTKTRDGYRREGGVWVRR